MEIVTTIRELKAVVKNARAQGNSIGFVPTMGYLHEGHLTLMRRAKENHGVVVASIFVNPLQFGPKEDFAVYPRDLERDAKLAESAGVDFVFAPAVEEMYPRGHVNVMTHVEVAHVTGRLCGASRPGHFRGVATVVTKLFNIVEPDVAYFGQKDAQQVVVIRRMAADLNMNLKIVSVPIVREPDGLAMSSRNIYLSLSERQSALVLSKSLRLADAMLRDGERSAAKIVAAMTRFIQAEPLAAIDYVSISDTETLDELETITGPVLIALAVKIGKTRLIDNLVWEG